MNKLEKLRLERDLYGLSLPQCKEHNLPLVRHDGGLEDDKGNLAGCWDCPFFGEDGQQCPHHCPDKWNAPWAGVDFGEEENVVQKHRREGCEAFCARNRLA